MEIPGIIAQTLGQQDVGFEPEVRSTQQLLAELRTRDDLAEQLVQPVLLQTPKQKALLLMGANSFADIDKLNDHLHCEVQALSKDKLAELLVKKGLRALPGLPQLLCFQTLVDERLLAADKIYLPAGHENGLLSLDREAFRKLIGQAKVGDFAVSLSKVKFDDGDAKRDIEDIHQAIRKYSSLQIRKRLSETLEIPPLSETAQQIIKLSADPNTDADELVAVVELDPGLSAQIVGWAASPYYSAPGKVNSIQDAIVRVLGFELVLNLALGLAIGKSLKIPSDSPDGITPYWLQSIYCALTVEKLNRCLPHSTRGAPGLCYLSGLLNNFGFLILAHVFPTHYSMACRYLEANPHINHKYIEQHLLGVTRDQMSSQLMESWNLPPEIVTSMRYQQCPGYRGDFSLYPNLSLVAKRLLAARGIGDIPAEPVPEQLYSDLSLDPQQAGEVVDKVLDCFAEIDNMLAIFT